MDMEETTASSGGVLARLRRIVVAAVILALVGVTLVLLAERNSRFYFLGTEGGQLVVYRGARLPWGKRVWEPQEPALAEAYAPIAMPEGVAAITEQRFDERQELDRAFFDLLAGWADARIRTDDPARMTEGLAYVHRAAMLPGISSEQQRRLRALRAEVAYYEGRDRLERGGRLIEEAREQLRMATEASPMRAREAVQILDELQPAIERLERALQTARGLRAPPMPALFPPPAAAPAVPAGGSGGAGGAGGAAGTAGAGGAGGTGGGEAGAPAPPADAPAPPADGERT